MAQQLPPTHTGYYAEEDATISLQGNGEGKPPLLRSRFPTQILESAGGEDGDALHLMVTGPEGAVLEGAGWIMGYVVKGGRDAVKASRTPPTPPKRAADKKGGGKKPPAAPKPKAQQDDLDALFADDFGDDGSIAPPVPRPTTPKPPASAPRPIPKAMPQPPARPAAAPPAPAAAQRPFRGPIPKPSEAKRQNAARRGGSVGYEVPE